MHLEAPDRFATALGRTEIERGVFGWVVCEGLGQCPDDVVDPGWVRAAQGRPALSVDCRNTPLTSPTHLVH